MGEWKETEIIPRVPFNWCEYKLEEIGSFKNGVNFGSSSFGAGYPVINVKHLYKNRHAQINCLDEITIETIKNIADYELRSGDILFARSSVTLEGTGQVVIVNKLPLKKTVFSGFIIRLRCTNPQIDNLFLSYLLRTKFYKEHFINIAAGTSIINLSQETLKKILVFLPLISEQKSISSVVSSLDDKIDLLHRQNVTLSAMAETLFRLWFVEEAKEAWEKKPLSSIATFLNGLACQKFPPKNIIDRLPVLKIKELSSGITENSDWASTDIKPVYVVNNGDVIFAWSASLMVKIWNGLDCILNQHLFKVTSTNFPKWFYYLWCRHHLEEFISISASHATTMGHIKRGDLDEAIVLVPSNKELKSMTEIIEPLIEKQIQNNNQINSLTKLRDTLLPKLMSGEVRVTT